MIITFKLNYLAKWGESVCIIGSADPNVNWTEDKPLELKCSANEHWSAEITVSDFVNVITYKYAIRQANGTYNYETGENRTIALNDTSCNYVLRDFWRNESGDKTFLSTAFVNSLFKRKNDIQNKISTRGNVQFNIQVPQIEPDKGLAIIGNIPELGNWDVNRKVELSGQKFPYWECALNVNDPHYTIEYKYVIYKLDTNEIIDYESGENRRLYSILPNTNIVCSDIAFRSSKASWKGAGVAIPVFSIRTNDGLGVGEFLDLKKMVDWCNLTGQKMIQTLPINDTTLLGTNRDSYPYNAVSVFALNPIYLNLEAVADLKTKAKEYHQTKDEFNKKTFVDYQVVVSEKWKYINLLYKQEKERTFASDEYQLFFQQNKEWLVPYAAFCYLRKKYNTPTFGTWRTHSTYHAAKIAKLVDATSKEYDKIAVHYFVQFHLDKQLRETVTYAHEHGIALKGDIPIGISPDSVDAWTNPELFNLATQAGAPPDDFSVVGQNWGFPTYNWDIMQKDNFAWWSKRFSKMADYFDAYRIDHILGFFRIWEMPKEDVWGLNGRFSPALPYTINDIWNMGISLSEERMTQAFIHENYIYEIFKEKTEYVKETFLQVLDFQTFSFKPEFDTQRKIEAYFAEHNIEDNDLKNGLYYLHCEVLFVRDLHNPHLLHPRIALHQSHSYQNLNGHIQHRLSEIHDDFFYRRHNEFWKESALRKLPSLIAATNMLVCGEDLGMVPATVPDVMNRLQILSLEIQRMPKETSVEFFHPNDAPYLSVCTTGTHDMNPLRAWWEENRDVTQRYFNNVMGRYGAAPDECTPDIAQSIIDQHIYSKAIWVILPMQDWLATSEHLRLPDAHAERINMPDNPHHFWCYRMHLSLEQLLVEGEFNDSIKTILNRANR